jgi:predicted phage terminase large subunit-like protein
VKKQHLKEILDFIYDDPMLVHRIFFPHRHEQASAPFHKELLLDWYSPEPNVVQTVFRGGGKSTLGEEGLTILACTRAVKNAVIIGSSELRANERLAAIKYELEYNDYLRDTFGDLTGDTWQTSKIVLANQVCIQALGWNQSLRGIKHLAWRPDFGWIDDVEDEEHVKDESARAKLIKRLLSVVIPAIDAPGRKLRTTGTILDRESLVCKLAKLDNWTSRIYPVKYRNPSYFPLLANYPSLSNPLYHQPEWIASWPERKPVHEIDALETQMRALGQHDVFMREYMCVATSEENKSFKPEYIKCQPIPRTYQATYAVYDPARTTNEATSAHTGKVVFSYQNARILVWESSGNFWKPDEIVHDIFQTNNQYNPILIGVEKDGLEEFLMQPLRHEQMKRGQVVPLRPLKAPKGKLSFIQGLQPYFKAGEIIFVPDQETHPQLIEQLLNYPTGRIDIPNALAYMQILTQGVPILDQFDPTTHVDPSLDIINPHPIFLAVHSEYQFTSAILFQMVRARYHIIADALMEGDPIQTLPDIIRQMSLTAMRPFKVIVPPDHFSQYDTLGMRRAAAAIPCTLHRGADGAKGLAELRTSFTTLVHGKPALSISPAAVWTLRAFSGGYRRVPSPASIALSATPAPGPYATLVHGLVSALGLARGQVEEGLDDGRRIAYTASGAPYLSSRR